ncbi:MAG: ABC transporter permease [Acidobacteriota bacterium]
MRSAATTTCLFDPNSSVTTSLSTDRFPEPMSANLRRITPRYFETMRIPLVAGRTFSPDDAIGSPPVVIINASLAQRLFPGQSALGQKIRRTAPNPPSTIVGIAPDVRDDGAAVEPQPTFYSPYLQANNVYLSLLVRAEGDPLSVRDAVRRAIWSLDRNVAQSSEKSLPDLMRSAVGAERLQMLLLSGFGLVALVLAVAGIYGMTSYAVVKRMREMGVRLAFGATPGNVIVEVVQRAVRIVAIGLAAGAALALIAQRIASLVVYGTARFDVQSAALIMAVLFVATLFAASVPALRVRNVQPALLLRDGV